LKIVGRVACFTFVSAYQATSPKLQHIRSRDVQHKRTERTVDDTEKAA
jgi:hypothetical protein